MSDTLDITIGHKIFTDKSSFRVKYKFWEANYL